MNTKTPLQSAYSTFVEQVNHAQVQRVSLGRDRIDYTLKPEFGHHRYTTRPVGSTDEVVSTLKRQGISVTIAWPWPLRLAVRARAQPWAWAKAKPAPTAKAKLASPLPTWPG